METAKLLILIADQTEVANKWIRHLAEDDDYSTVNTINSKIAFVEGLLVAAEFLIGDSIKQTHTYVNARAAINAGLVATSTVTKCREESCKKKDVHGPVAQLVRAGDS